MRLGLGLTLSGGGLPAFYPDATLALDFVAGAYRVGAGGYSRPDFASLPGLTVSRASVGYAERQDGTLVQFGNNVARITDKGLLVEESRTNLALWSQDISNAVYTKSGSSVGATTGAPDGSTTAQKLVEDNGNTNHATTQTISKAASALTYTYTGYAKAGERSRIVVWCNGASTANRVQAGFDLSNGSIWGAATNIGAFTGGAASIAPSGAGFYRFTVTFTTDASLSVDIRVFLNDGVATVSTPAYQGNGASGAFVWGQQLEQAAFPTSYIPTTSASATRAADSVSVGGLSLTAPYTMLVAIQATGAATASGFPDAMRLDDGSLNNSVAIYQQTSTGNWFVEAKSGGVSSGALSSGTGTTGIQTIAARVASSNGGISRNGAAAVDNASLVVPSVNTLRLGSSSGGNNQPNTYIRKALIYPTAFSDQQLQSASQ